ncbi:MAG: sigma-70 family RNA polymerase sigma factor [bacterium]|nr:sigma-70 family RNA polymerase sigma factor [bacterium]
MPDLPQTRQSLLIRLGRHSDVAWAEFLTVYETAIVRYCRALGLQDADARDATQEVLAAVHSRLPSWDHEAAGGFRAWLFRVARNIAVDAIAARARRSIAGSVTGLDPVPELSNDPRSSHETALDLEYRRALFEWAATHVRSEVRDTTWQAFQLTAVRGRTAEEAAAELGVSTGNVYTAKCRVVARMRARIATLGDAVLEDPAAFLAGIPPGEHSADRRDDQS